MPENAALEERIKTIFNRLDQIDKRLDQHIDRTDENRERVTSSLEEIRRDLALGEQSHASVIAKLDSLDKKVGELVLASVMDKGAAGTWAKIVDPLLKVFTAVAIAYLIFYLKIK